MTATSYLVCDRCGALTSEPAGRTTQWTCAECGSKTAWLFSNMEKALQHTRDIRGKATA